MYFGFLQANDVSIKLIADGFQLMRTGAHAIDVKADDAGHCSDSFGGVLILKGRLASGSVNIPKLPLPSLLRWCA